MKFEMDELRIDEAELSVKRIIEECIRKIGVIIVWGLIFAILIPSLLFLKDKSEYNSAMGEPTFNEDVVELSSADYMKADMYFLLKNRLEQIEVYRENSILMQLDFNNVYQTKVQFHVLADENMKYDIACALANYVNGGALAAQISTQEGFPESKYIQEVIYGVVEGQETGIASGVVQLRILATSEEECEKYAQAATSLIKEYSNTLQQNLSQHSLKILTGECVTHYFEEVYTVQRQSLLDWQTAREELTKHTASLSELQKIYISEVAEGEEGLTDSTISVKAPKFSIVLAAVGFVLGAILAAGVICIKVMFGRRLQTEKELLKRLHISHFGNIRVSDLKWCDKLIDKLLYGRKTLSTEDQLEEVSKRLQLYLQNAKVEQIGLIGTTEELDCKNIGTLSDIMQEKGITCNIIGNVVNDPAAFEKLSGLKNVVLIETMGKSKVKDIYDESILCTDLDVKVIGYISLQV